VVEGHRIVHDRAVLGATASEGKAVGLAAEAARIRPRHRVV